jgi:hypothetical protein
MTFVRYLPLRDATTNPGKQNVARLGVRTPERGDWFQCSSRLTNQSDARVAPTGPAVGQVCFTVIGWFTCAVLRLAV